ncbi:uncharacterized protein LOC107876709 [Capsicum annuum]|uniref:uncharacterized protein LOC107876709 n=1 Tax=Capsicum annuum TaxID=4072 RepID=UPI001FB0849F|nr:uncharacterized protein LOC107876709 [Capsicum annuum]
MTNTRSRGNPLLLFDLEPERIIQTPRRMLEQVRDGVSTGVQDPQIVPPPSFDPNAALLQALGDLQNVVDRQKKNLLAEEEVSLAKGGLSRTRQVVEHRDRFQRGRVPLMPAYQHLEQNNKKDTIKEPVLKSIPRSRPPFPQRLKKKQQKSKYQKILFMLKELLVNIQLIEALEKMPGYAKFMKNLSTKKRLVSYEPVNNIHYYNVVATISLVEKKEYLGAFTIPCTIGSINFTWALCDLGASINLMPLIVFKQLVLGAPNPFTMRLVVADRIVKNLVSFLYDVLVEMAYFIFPADL